MIMISGYDETTAMLGLLRVEFSSLCMRKIIDESVGLAGRSVWDVHVYSNI